MSESTKNTTVSVPVVVAVAAMFCFTVAAVVVLTVALPEGGNAGSLVALLLGSLAPTIATITTLGKVGNVETKVNELSNGVMQQKLVTALADVLGDDQVDPAARAQVAAARVAQQLREGGVAR